MSLEFIAGFAGVVFSVLIVVALEASREVQVFRSGIGIWVHILFITGVVGLVILPCAILGSLWKWGWVESVCVVATSLISAAAIASLSGYYIFYYRDKMSHGSSIVAATFPPDRSFFRGL
jgi:hypothetical protein